PGEKQGTVEVTYPDGSKDEVPVQVKVGTDAEEYAPKGQLVKTDLGKAPSAKAGVSNKDDLPQNVQYSWKTPVKVATPGEKPGTVEVTYPDGSKDEVPVQVKVGTDAEEYTPKGQLVKTDLGKAPSAEAGVANKGDLPKDTQYMWEFSVEVAMPGEKPGTVEVTYPDGSKDEVPVQVKVGTDAEEYTPKGQLVKTDLGKVPSAATAVSNKTELPRDTKYMWKLPVKVTTPGKTQATVVVTYPDGSITEVAVTVAVNSVVSTTKVGNKRPTDADKYVLQGKVVKTTVGNLPFAGEGVANKAELPKYTTFTWKDFVDVTMPGQKVTPVVVTYPDGSQDSVLVAVYVSAKRENVTQTVLQATSTKKLLNLAKETSTNNVKNKAVKEDQKLVNKGQTKVTLPQTGDENATLLHVLGALLLLAAALLGLSEDTKKHD
ncbi:Rib/alpha-like domain-containing protein, partial [Ligilactobacillus apodemi]|uniref:Rib/alpha-like domain-containing protein n=1 Tax=Ligilactobacillus apodemi TaxID=307126 RepID=UPI00046A0E73